MCLIEKNFHDNRRLHYWIYCPYVIFGHGSIGVSSWSVKVTKETIIVSVNKGMSFVDG